MLILPQMIVECPGCQSRYDVTGRPPGTSARCRCGTILELPEPESSAGSLSCPSCGGNVAATNHSCEYCQAELLVKACPRCFAKIFHGSKHCTECGAKVVVPAAANADGTASKRMCPRCDEALVGRLVGDVLLDECGTCHGVFLDVAALERVLSERRQARAESLLGTARPEVGEGAVSAAQPSGSMYVRCPDCDTLMNRKNFAQGAGIIVDVCRDHGTWFDANELPRIIDFVMKGGLERAERKEAERMRDDARRVRASAQMSAVAPASMGSMGVGRRSDRVAIFGSLLGSVGRLLVD